jgi:CheY-like chemotaxis protein
VRSTPGIGTTFIIYLPASECQPDEKVRVEAIEIDKGKAKIMVMDDEVMVRDVAKAMLSRIGHEVLLVQDGAEAVAVYREHSDSGNPIDIVIMDLTIPGGMGGQEAVNEILAFDPDAKVIVSSGYSNDPIMANCQEYGFCSAIVKPYQLSELSEIINKVMT